jgi:DNA polymerase-3 subunit delta
VLPFLASHQVVRLSGLIGASAQRRAKSGDDPARPGVSPEGLAELVRGLPETTVLVMEEGTLRPTNAHVRALEKLDVPSEISPCPAPQGEERVRWVLMEVANRGGAIDRQAAALLAARLPGALWAVSSAIDTLLAYAGPGSRITPAAVEELVVSDEDVNAFHLGDAIMAGDAARALTLLHGLLGRGMAEEQIMAMLVGRVRDWTLAAAFKADKVTEGEAIKRLGWSPGRYRLAARGAANFARGALPRAYQALVIADEALKSRPGDERHLILDMLVLTLATRGSPEALSQMFPIPPPLP